MSRHAAIFSRSVFWLLLCLAAALPAVRAQVTVFAIDYSSGNSNLYSINSTTWSATLVGSTGQYLEGLAISPGGQLFATSSGGALFSINPTTGASTLIGNTGRGNIEGIDFNGNTLLGVSFTGMPVVFSIDTSTGATTDIVTLSSNPGTVRAIAVMDSNTLFVRGDGPPINLDSVNLTTGAVTSIGSPVLNGSLYAMDFSTNGTLIGFDSDGSVWSLNTTTAATTLLGNTGGQLWLDMTIQAIPEPSTYVLLALGTGLLGIAYRRRLV